MEVAGRVFVEPTVAEFAEADVVEHLVRAASGIALQHAVQVAGKSDEFDALQERHDGMRLRHVADEPAKLRTALTDVATEHRAAAGRGM